MTDIATAPDLAAIKQRQQATWASGDYHMIGTQILIVSELLIEALDVHSTERVLDVATGSGNAALAAARRGCAVVGVDYVPALLDRARQRADAEGVDGRVHRGRRRGAAVRGRQLRRRQLGLRGDVRAGPGADRQRARARLPARRPDRPRRAHAGGFIGNLFKTSAGTSRRRPASARRSSGAPRSGCASCSATAIAEIRVAEAPIRLPRRSPEAYVEYWRRYYGPTLKAFEAVGEDGREALEADILELIARFNRADDGTMVVAERVPRGGHRQALKPRSHAISSRGHPCREIATRTIGEYHERRSTMGQIACPEQPDTRWRDASSRRRRRGPARRFRVRRLGAAVFRSGDGRGRRGKHVPGWRDALRSADLRAVRVVLAQPARRQPVRQGPRTSTQKYVASTTLEEPLPWANSTLLKGDVADAVAKLKKELDKDLVILGSGELIRSLMPHGLIDEYTLQIHPLVLGHGPAPVHRRWRL